MAQRTVKKTRGNGRPGPLPMHQKSTRHGERHKRGRR